MRLTSRALTMAFVLLSIGLALCCRNTPAPCPAGPLPPSEAAQPAIAPADRPAEWAQRLDKPGLPNLHKVADDLYRGAQPTERGFLELKAMGVRTVINLRHLHTADDRTFAAKAGLELVEIPMNTWDVGEDDAIRFLRVVTDKPRGPFFVHCQHGADRTGSMVAAYRVAVCDWSKEKAAAEMNNGGFGFHTVWQNLPKFIEALDVDKLKRSCLTAPAPATPDSGKPPAPKPGDLPA